MCLLALLYVVEDVWVSHVSFLVYMHIYALFYTSVFKMLACMCHIKHAICYLEATSFSEMI